MRDSYEFSRQPYVSGGDGGGGGGGGNGESNEKNNPCSITVRGGDPNQSSEAAVNKLSPDNNFSFYNVSDNRNLGASEGPAGLFFRVEIASTYIPTSTQKWEVSQYVLGQLVADEHIEFTLGDDHPFSDRVDNLHPDKTYVLDKPGINRDLLGRVVNADFKSYFVSSIATEDGKNICSIRWQVHLVVRNNKLITSELKVGQPTYNGVPIKKRK